MFLVELYGEVVNVRKSLNLDFDDAYQYSINRTSPNRAYLAPLRFAQILLRRTSDTLGTLSAIRRSEVIYENLYNSLFSQEGQLIKK